MLENSCTSEPGSLYCSLCTRISTRAKSSTIFINAASTLKWSSSSRLSTESCLEFLRMHVLSKLSISSLKCSTTMLPCSMFPKKLLLSSSSVFQELPPITLWTSEKIGRKSLCSSLSNTSTLLTCTSGSNSSTLLPSKS